METSPAVTAEPVTEERRAPEGEPQVLALSQAEEAGVLPDEDRRTQEEKDADDAADLADMAAVEAKGETPIPFNKADIAGYDAAPHEANLHVHVDQPDAVLPALPDAPFPHDIGTPHQLDNLPVGTQVEKDSPDTFSVSGPTGYSGHSIADGDVLHLLPVGAQMLLGEPGTPTAVMVRLPAVDGVGAIASFGHRLHEAIAGLWRWIGHEV